MTFFSVVFGVMAVSILLVHWLTNYFGCRLEYKSLVLCAVMAFAVVIGAALMSPYLTQAYYIRLGVFILVATAIVTAYNEYLIRQSSTLAVAGVAEPPEEASVAEAVSEAETEEASDTLPEEEPPKVCEKVLETEELPIGEELPQDSALDEAADAGKAEPEVLEVEVPVKQPAEEMASAEEMAELLPHLGSLDDILDYAYEMRVQGNRRRAILANRKALECYAEDDYAPFIAIELGNLYKEQADYDAAIRVYEKSLDIPSVARNDATYQEFAKNLSYLRTVQYILSKHNALDTSFQEIPKEYLEEIEEDFQSRHIHSQYLG